MGDFAMTERERQSLLNRAVDLRRRMAAFQQNEHDHAVFCKSVIALLEKRCVGTISELPVADKQLLAERGALLIPDIELESERTELERLQCELLAQLPPDVFPVH
jgi:hypothetical protein